MNSALIVILCCCQGIRDVAFITISLEGCILKASAGEGSVVFATILQLSYYHLATIILPVRLILLPFRLILLLFRLILFPSQGIVLQTCCDSRCHVCDK